MGRPRREGTGLDDALKQEPGVRSQEHQESGALSGKQLEVKASALEFCSPILWQTRPLLNSLTSDFSATGRPPSASCS